jgi:SOS-response transcriptional repressor LexA
MALQFIRDHIASKGYPPTVREIGAHMGIRSTNGVADHLRALERKGYLQSTDFRARGLRLISPLTGMSDDPDVHPHDQASVFAENRALRQLVTKALNTVRAARMPDVEDWRIDTAIAEMSRELAAIGGGKSP